MTPAEAYHVLQLEPGAGREQIERQHAEQKQILREKRAKAQAPGLKAHIQQGLSRLDTAREVLIHREDVASGLARSRRGGSADSRASLAARRVRSVTAADVDAAVDRLPRRLSRQAEGLACALLALLAGAGAGAILVLVSIGSADHRALWVGGGGLVGLVPGTLWWRATVVRLRREEWVKVREALAQGEERPVAGRRPVRRLALVLLFLLAGGVSYRRWTPAAWPSSGEQALARVGRVREEALAADEGAGGNGSVAEDRAPGDAPVPIVREAPGRAAETTGKEPTAGDPAATLPSSPRRSALPAGAIASKSPVAPASLAPSLGETAVSPGKGPPTGMPAAAGTASTEIPDPAAEDRAPTEKTKRERAESPSAERADSLSPGHVAGPIPASARLARVPDRDRARGSQEGARGNSPETHAEGGGRAEPLAAGGGVPMGSARRGEGAPAESRAGQARAFHARAVKLQEAKRPGLALFALDQARAAGRADDTLAANLRQEFTDARAVTVWQAPPHARAADGSDPPQDSATVAAALDEALRDSLVPVLPAVLTLERAEGALGSAPRQPLLRLRVETGAKTHGENTAAEWDVEGSNAPQPTGQRRRTLRAQVVLISRELAAGEAVLLEITASQLRGPEARSTAEEEAASWAALQAELRGQLQQRRLELLTKLAEATLSVMQAQRGAAEDDAQEMRGDLEWGWFAVWTEAGLPLPQHEAERAARQALALPEAADVGP